MEEARHEKLKISNDLLDVMLVGVIYTTNAIKSLNGVIRSRMKTKRILGSDESALKLVWIAVSKASQKWTMPISNWSKALSHFYVRYADRFPKVA